VNVSHILVKTDHRSKEEALKLAKEIRAKVVAPHTDFAKLAEELSEDKSAKTNHGDLGFFVANQMDSAFSDASFAMKKKGEISQPVLSQFGYHIIRYQDRKPSFVRSFDEAKDAIMADMRQKYIQDKRTEKFNALVSPSHQLDVARIVDLRDQLAHGRVSSGTPTFPLMLLKFGRPVNGKVPVVARIEMTDAWFREQRTLVHEAIQTVYLGAAEQRRG